MKLLWRVWIIIVVFSAPVYAEQMPNVTSQEVRLPALSAPSAHDITYRSTALPLWSFDIQHQRTLPAQEIWIDTITHASPLDSITLSASRTVSATSSQHVFARVQASNNAYLQPLSWVTLPENAGVAASVGWLIGDREALNMAVEFEHREVGEKEVNSLNLGIQYHF
ncbi:hypothetical protein OCL06_00985 [Alteromonas sp. ASW11-19]|uniref:Outer membrane protein beta-barrel domain-containing protein n=1 Tax=Alteromonas salexigens TaxID=2982530 RepID=A0ABT2VLM1_9ALTE|nr:hypothetical protein [Alteromonas salexigens]MCU7553166.1 hypothetical protein [Alteromonas salexigens]